MDKGAIIIKFIPFFFSFSSRNLSRESQSLVYTLLTFFSKREKKTINNILCVFYPFNYLYELYISNWKIYKYHIKF